MQTPAQPLTTRQIVCLASLAVAVTAFWSLRALYWSQVHEAPFSDLLDYVLVGRNIHTNFFWGRSADYPTYYTPITPAFIAASLQLGGERHFELVFRILVQTIAFAGVLLLGREIAKATQQPLLGVALVLVVALCQPSIFWSYKLGTESVSEALLLLTAALALCAIRTGGWLPALVCGVVGLALALNRPQFFPAVFLTGFVVAATNALGAAWRSRGHRAIVAQFARQFACFGIGTLLVWTPWVVRNYAVTHDLVLIGTSSAESFLWEAGGASIGKTPYPSLTLSDGSVITEFGLPALRRRVAHLPTDAERNKQLQLVANAWLRENWREMPALISRRLAVFATTTGASGLTTVPRERLFAPTSSFPAALSRALNSVLLDKSAATSALAVVGAIIVVLILRGAGLILAILAIAPVLTASLVISIERAVESLISLQLWLALFAVVSLATVILKAMRSRIRPSRVEST